MTDRKPPRDTPVLYRFEEDGFEYVLQRYNAESKNVTVFYRSIGCATWEPSPRIAAVNRLIRERAELLAKVAELEALVRHGTSLAEIIMEMPNE